MALTLSPRRQPAGVEIDGDRLRTLRKTAGVTLRDFAARCEISWGYLSQIERGHRPTISPPVFVRICDALGLPDEERESLIRPDARAAA